MSHNYGRRIAVSMAIVPMVAVMACSGLNSRVGQGHDRLALENLEEAKEHATKVLNSIDEKQEELSDVAVATAAGLTAAGTGAGAAGVLDASSNVITGFAVAAAGFLGISDLTSPAQRMQILETGEQAIFCALEQTKALEKVTKIAKRGNLLLVPARKTDGTSAKTLEFSRSDVAIGQLTQHYADVLDAISSDSIDEKSRIGFSVMIGSIINDTQFTARVVSDALSSLKYEEDVLATTLTITVERIRAEMERQLRNTLPDPQEIFESQRKRVGAMVKESQDVANNAVTRSEQSRMLQTSGFMSSIGFTEIRNTLADATLFVSEGNMDQLNEIKKTLDDISDCFDTIRPGNPEPTPE